jgi:MFS family permease
MLKSSKGRTFYMLTLIFLIYLFDYADRKVISALFTSIEKEWLVSNAQLEWLNSIVSLMISIFVIPMSILVDRWSRKKMISLMIFVWSIATLMCAFAENYTQLLLFRALTGFGEAAYAAAAVALITKAFPREHRSKYIGIYDAAAPIGAGIGIVAGGYIGAVYGWRNAFGLVAIPGLILSFLFLFVNDYHTVKLTKKVNESLSFSKEIVHDTISLLKIPTLRYLYIAYGAIIALNTTVIDFMPKYLEKDYGLLPQKASMLSGVLAIGVLFGAILGGFIADMWGKTNKDAKILVSAISTILSIVFLLVALQVTSLNLTLVLFALFGLNSVAFLAPISTIIQEVVHTRVRALSFGINVLVMNLFVVIVSVMIGKIADIQNLRFALSLLPIFGILATILFLKCKDIYHIDLKKING